MKRSAGFQLVAATVLVCGLVLSSGCRKGQSTALTVLVGAPTITTQPSSQTVTAPASVTFTVVATGSANTYQWRKGGVNIGGATSASYTIATTATTDSGNYDVVITNGSGSVTSNTAVLTVNVAGAPSITTQPANQSVTAPATATFTVVAAGNPVLSYQWYRGAGTGTPVGTNSASYTTAATSVGADNGAQFHVVVTNGLGSIDSSLATLTVTAPTAATITTQPTSQTVAEPATATFTVVAGGGGPYTYQWYRGAGTGTPVGTNSASYTTAATTKAGDDGAQFHVVVTNAGGSIDSNLVTLTVTAPYTGNPISVSTANLTLPTAAAGSTTKVSGTVTLTNTSGLPVSVALTGGAAWLSGSPTPVVIPGGGTAVIAVTGDPAVGSGTANLTLTNTPGGKTQTIAVTFSAAGVSAATAGVAAAYLDAAISGAVTLDGSSTTGAATYQWTQIAGPTVTLTGATTNTASFTAPTTVPKRSLKFQLEAKPAAGPSSFAIVTVTVYENITGLKARIFLDPVAGNDANTASTNSCSKATPMKTLANALADATSTGSPRADIYMAAGTDTSAGLASLNLRTGVSIYGGFETTNWTRDVDANLTVVDGSAMVVVGSNAIAMYNNGQPMATTDVLDGFKIIGGSGDFSMGLSLGNAALPTVQNLTIVGGAATSGDCECVRVSSGANPIFKNCTFTAGTATASSIGVLVNNTGNASFDGCTFGGGTPTSDLYGLKLTTTSTTAVPVSNCNFLGTGTAGGRYFGIYTALSGLTLSKSIVNGGATASSSYGLHVDFRGGTASTNVTTIDRCFIAGGPGVSDAHAVYLRYEPTCRNAIVGDAVTITNSYLTGGSGAAENYAVEGSDNGVAGATNPLRLKLVNNTIDAGSAGTFQTGVYLHAATSPGVSLVAHNNIFFVSKTGTGITRLIWEETAPGINTPANMTNNLFFIDTAFTGTRDYYFIRNIPTNTDIADTTLTLTDPTSINGFLTATVHSGNINLTTAQTIANATVFAFPTASPFDPHLKAGCPAVDAGNNAVAPANDIDGDTRPGGSTVDIGADEN